MEKYFTVIIGSGAAAYNCADCLYDMGVKDIAILTENRLFGTSRNTGSDKQTYYKLGIAGEVPDSVFGMAESLYSGGGADGDICLTEAANSLRAFYKLCEAGVPFPTNRYGEYVGYKTDHDPLQRATSVGPLTSKLMTEALEKRVQEKGIKILDKYYVAEIVTRNNRAVGVIAIFSGESGEEVVPIAAQNVVLATGGPAAIYRDSVYPECHTGSTSLGLRAGAKMSNLSEWQYGLASTKFRWNVSGTYQQVLPRYISVSEDGVEREFLHEYFDSPEKALDAVFLKGYQWPFDSLKIGGSSYVDLVVQYETNVLHNRVYMDFTANPRGWENFGALSEETRSYLTRSEAAFGKPIDRLRKMNPAAIELYKSHGIDITREPLEVAVCAQHCNGGVEVDSHYMSSVKNLYVCGEAAGTFGLYRPGGSALNSGQVGALRAAESIALTDSEPYNKEYEKAVSAAEKALREELKSAGESGGEAATYVWKNVRAEMSAYASNLRVPSELKRMAEKFDGMLSAGMCKKGSAVNYLKSRDALVSARAVLDAMYFACENMGSRGGAIYATDAPKYTGGVLSVDALPEREGTREEVIETVYEGGKFFTSKRKRRPIPKSDDWFENVWRDYRERTARKK